MVLIHMMPETQTFTNGQVPPWNSDEKMLRDGTDERRKSISLSFCSLTGCILPWMVHVTALCSLGSISLGCEQTGIINSQNYDLIDAGKDWRREEKGTAEIEMVGWHHQLNRHEFGQALGVGEGQGSLACCSPWGRRESDRTEWLKNNGVTCPLTSPGNLTCFASLYVEDWRANPLPFGC